MLILKTVVAIVAVVVGKWHCSAYVCSVGSSAVLALEIVVALLTVLILKSVVAILAVVEVVAIVAVRLGVVFGCGGEWHSIAYGCIVDSSAVLA